MKILKIITLTVLILAFALFTVASCGKPELFTDQPLPEAPAETAVAAPDAEKEAYEQTARAEAPAKEPAAPVSEVNAPPRTEYAPAANDRNPVPESTESKAEKTEAGFTEFSFESGGVTLKYLLYTPENARAGMPLIVYLHSANSKGDDTSLLTSNDGFPKYLSDGALGALAAYVLMPQIPASERGWVNLSSFIAALTEKTASECGADRSNISLTGHSVGGTGSWNIAAAKPGLFARIAPLSGSVRANNDTVAALKNTAVRAFVGSGDTVIDPAMSQRMVEALRKAGADAEITVFEGASHEDVPALAYLDESLDLIYWLCGGKTAEKSAEADEKMNMYKNSEFIEKEQPELTEETKRLISAYQKSPTVDNYLALRDEVIKNYDAVLERKEAKLESLKKETAGKVGGDAKVAEMEEIVQEMYSTYWNRINSSMLRFTDSRLLKWKISDAPKYDFIPVMGTGESIYVSRTPVTCSQYAEFLKETGHPAPPNWKDGAYPAGEDDLPVNFVSKADAEAYCKWLTSKDGTNVYRLPSESEWELAAGHMPKDADFNCKVTDGRVSVYKYENVTRGAHGGIDFWGNVWEWTSTERENADVEKILAVKGGSWKSPRTDCRTEHRKEGRAADKGYEDVGFRVIRVTGGKEPAQKVDLYTLAAPTVRAGSEGGKMVLSWNAVPGAVEYQIYSYSDKTGLLEMISRTKSTEASLPAVEDIKYIVQALSYTEISDNVRPEYAVGT